jgi:hypothetical protein
MAAQANISNLIVASSYWLFDGVTGNGASVVPADTTTANYGFYITSTDGGFRLTGSITDITIKHTRWYTTGTGQNAIYQADSSTGDKNNVVVSHCLFDGFNEVIRDGTDTWNDTVLEYSVILNSQGDTSGSHGNTVNAMWQPLVRMIIRYNVWKGQHGNGITGLISANDANLESLRVYGNVFDSIDCGYVMGGDNGTHLCNNSWFINNTVINCPTWHAYYVLGRTAGSANTATNNLYYLLDNDWPYSPIWSGDYDAWYACTVANYPSEGHSSTVNANPFLDWANGDYRLAANTSAGVATGYGTDPLGHTRSTWSRGAFEYSTTNNPPVITVQPTGTTNSTTGGFTLNLTCTGDQPLKYQWQVGGSTVQTSTSTALWVQTPAGTNQSGAYSCWITNSWGSVTSSVAQILITNAALSYNPIPVIISAKGGR